MGYLSLDEIKEEVQQWNFIKKLPEELDGFSKELLYQIDEVDTQVLNICVFKNASINSEIRIIYSSETFDYILVRKIGLNEFRDIRFIFKEREIFEEKLKEKFSDIIKKMARRDEFKTDILIHDTGLINWEYGKSLPKRIGAFELFANPENIIEYINGSVIFLDYSDFEKKDQFVLVYNKLRDDYFAEIKISGVKQTIRDFDCNTLDKMEKLLKKKLELYLEKIENSEHEI